MFRQKQYFEVEDNSVIDRLKYLETNNIFFDNIKFGISIQKLG